MVVPLAAVAGTKVNKVKLICSVPEHFVSMVVYFMESVA